MRREEQRTAEEASQQYRQQVEHRDRALPAEKSWTKASWKPRWTKKQWKEWSTWKYDGRSSRSGALSGFCCSNACLGNYQTQWKGGLSWKNWLSTGREPRERMDIVIDSGASTSILPRDVARYHRMKPSTSNCTYTSASKHEVKPEGEKELVCGFMDGSESLSHWEVGDVSRPLSAVSKIIHRGHRVWFDTEDRGGSGCYSYETGRTLKFFEKDGVFVLPAWIRSETSTSSPTPGRECSFGRPGQNP